MIRPDPVTLTIGESRALVAARYAAWGLALAAVGFAPLHTPLIICLLASLLLLRPLPARRGQLRLYRDGYAYVEIESEQAFHAYQVEGAWVSAWISVLPLARASDHRIWRLLVCAGRNDQTEYRRFLQRLRLGQPSAPDARKRCQ